MLKDIGLDFKRIPLDESVSEIVANSYTPEVIKGDKRFLIHDVKNEMPDVSFKKPLGDLYKNHVRNQARTGFDVFIDKASEPLWLNYKEHGDLIEYNQIVVDKYIEGTVVLDYGNLNPSVHLGHTIIHVKEGAKLNLIKFQSNHLDSSFVDETLINVEDRGYINVIDIQLGSNKMIINYDTNLAGYESKCSFNSIYLASDQRGLDLSFTANHMGKKSTSSILGKGVLSGEARKVFRGTLNFENGSAKSVGKEEEVVLLLSEKVKSDSIPALMCSEDDVIGEHGASIGQLDENQLFYLMSRGLSEDEAKLLVISSSFREILENIEDELLREKTLGELERRIKDVV